MPSPLLFSAVHRRRMEHGRRAFANRQDGRIRLMVLEARSFAHGTNRLCPPNQLRYTKQFIKLSSSVDLKTVFILNVSKMDFKIHFQLFQVLDMLCYSGRCNKKIESSGVHDFHFVYKSTNLPVLTVTNPVSFPPPLPPPLK